MKEGFKRKTQVRTVWIDAEICRVPPKHRTSRDLQGCIGNMSPAFGSPRLPLYFYVEQLDIVCLPSSSVSIIHGLVSDIGMELIGFSVV